MTKIPAQRLEKQAHITLALRAADSAARVLSHFEVMHPHDDRPRRAIEAVRAWARGRLAMKEARVAAFAAHAAARDAGHPAARFAARAAGHAAATAHVAAHARHAEAYATKAEVAASGSHSDGDDPSPLGPWKLLGDPCIGGHSGLKWDSPVCG
jgi:hypothetical protein